MTPDEFLSLADNPNLIEGIYNYCDRWCERCPMTSRCLVFLSTPKMEDEPAENQQGFSEAFIKQMKDSFSMTIQLIQKLADERGIDLSTTPEQDEAFHRQHESMREQINLSPLTIAAKNYLTDCHQWLNTNQEMLTAKGEQLKSMGRMRVPNEDPLMELVDLKDAIDVINYYHYQIFVKIMRAQSGVIRGEELPDDEGEQFPKDSDGSAKVALIGIDRSIGSWGILLQSLPEQEETILNLLTMLERLRRMIENTFPNARAFKRVGFDD